ncbi:MAG: hypothetical protein ABIG95_01820 [Candidatus Woesearchaeota archaeon]
MIIDDRIEALAGKLVTSLDPQERTDWLEIGGVQFRVEYRRWVDSRLGIPLVGNRIGLYLEKDFVGFSHFRGPEYCNIGTETNLAEVLGDNVDFVLSEACIALDKRDLEAMDISDKLYAFFVAQSFRNSAGNYSGIATNLFGLRLAIANKLYSYMLTSVPHISCSVWIDADAVPFFVRNGVTMLDDPECYVGYVMLKPQVDESVL